MEKAKYIFVLIFLLILSDKSFSQFSDFSISAKVNYTTTSRLYPSSTGSVYYFTDEFYAIDGIYGYGGEVRCRFLTERLYFGLSGEYISGSVKNESAIPTVFYTDGFKLYHLEINSYLIIPFSTEKFRMYIGGGMNFNYGKRVREILDVSAVDISNPVNFGIQVLSGFEFYFKKDISIRFEMKFRDPQVETESKFNTTRIIHNNIAYNLTKDPFKSKINLDGIAFDLSIAYSIF